jgi:hypothetical protein
MGNQQSSVLATSQKTEQSFEQSSSNKGQNITDKAVLENEALKSVSSEDAMDLFSTKTDSETDDESDEENDDEDDEGKLQ